jgi:hypothetical protein
MLVVLEGLLMAQVEAVVALELLAVMVALERPPMVAMGELVSIGNLLELIMLVEVEVERKQLLAA